MPTAQPTRTIGLYAAAYLPSIHRELDGILSFQADQGGYSIRDYCYRVPHKSLSLGPSPPWVGQVDGAIVSVGTTGSVRETVDWLISGGVPMVSLSGDFFDGRLPQVKTDPTTIGVSAVNHFIELGHEHFAFVGFARSDGSRQIAQGFVAALEPYGRSPQLYDVESVLAGTAEDYDWLRTEVDLVEFLEQLPKPVGILALNDAFARGICWLCEQHGLDVPNEVGVIGTGDSDLARANSPTLSSVQIDCHAKGSQAMAILHRMLNGQPRPPRPTLVTARSVVARKSTTNSPLIHADILRAKRYMESLACEGLTVEQLMQSLAMSRRTFEHQFLEQVGCTPGQYIGSIRLKRAKNLLTETQLSVTRVSRMVGFANVASLIRFFRKHTGQSPTEFRLAQQ